MDYKEQLSQNAEANYILFRNKELQKTPKEVFDNSFEINAFTELHGYLTGSNDLDDDMCEFLCKDGESVINILYKQYLKSEYASLSSWDEISSFIINDYEYYRDPKDKKNMEM